MTPSKQIEELIDIGSKFGRLTVIQIRRGAKNAHAQALCRCDCGNTRSVRHTNLRRGKITCCAACALRLGWTKRERMNATEARLREQEGVYKFNARRKGVVWHLTRDQFREIVAAPCRYCGAAPAGGVDRLDNSSGYTPGNAVPACSPCNYAKRQMSAAEFLDLAKRIYEHTRKL